MVTFPGGRALPSRAAAALLGESRKAVELLERMLGTLEPIGLAGEMRALAHELDERLQRDEALVELAGPDRAKAVETLVGENVIAAELAAGVTVRLRPGARFGFSARWPDGRREDAAPDPGDALAARLAELERQVGAETAAVTRLGEALQAAARNAGRARTELNASEQARTTPFPRPPRKSWLRRLFARLLVFLSRLFRGNRALPPGELERAAVESEIVVRSRKAADAADEVGKLEAALAAAKSALAPRTAEVADRRQTIEKVREANRRTNLQRLVELTGATTGSFEVEITHAGIPDGVVLLLRAPAGLWRETVDARIDTDQDHDDLRARLEHLREQRLSEIARRLAAALCDCRNQVVDAEKRARHTHEQRLGDLTARRIVTPEQLRRDAHDAAQLPVARQASQIVDEAAGRLESLLAQVRTDWEQRIAACAGLEQLRAEVAAIENGAAHRLSLVCDELRESMTVHFVRLVLDLSRGLRQELIHKRLQVARGGSAKLDESFENVRVVLPATLDAAFEPLRVSGVGELLSTERGFFDPLLRTLTREKKTCLTRLGVRLDEIQRSTTRELYAAAVFISPLILNSFSGLTDELLAAHQHWVDTRIAEENRSFSDERLRQEPALALVSALEEEERRLAALLEKSA